MPHLVILYTGNLDQPADQGGTDMKVLCRALADTMLAARDEQGKQVFPTGGTRALAYPAPHFAVADDGAVGRTAGGDGNYAFVYLNLRMAKGRSGCNRFGRRMAAGTGRAVPAGGQRRRVGPGRAAGACTGRPRH